MWLMGMRMGFTQSDLMGMTLPRLNAFISAYNEMNGAESNEARWANQDDIDALA